MGRAKKIAATRAALLLLLAVPVSVLGGCFGGGGGGEQTTTEGTDGAETTPARTVGGDTTTGRGEITTAEVAATNVKLTPSRDSGVVGNATITDTPGGVEVALDVEGLPTRPGTAHVAHIHEGGTCAGDRAGNGAPVQYPLDPLITGEDGSASNATTIEGASLEQLTSGTPKYVNVHAETPNEGVVPPGIACADLPGTGGEATTGVGGETTASGR